MRHRIPPTVLALGLALVAGCASTVHPLDGDDVDAMDGGDGADGALHMDGGSSSYRPCSTVDISPACPWCVGAATDAHDGLCAPINDQTPIPQSNSTCFGIDTAAFCFATQPGTDACFGCVPLDFCVTTYETGRDVGSRETDYCRYGDGTHVTNGVIPPVTCPTGSSGLLCGTGCVACANGMGCWGQSEVSGLGACVTPNAANCQPGNPCHTGFACLLPNTMSSDPFDRGFCVAIDRCNQIAALAPSRFSCAP